MEDIKKRWWIMLIGLPFLIFYWLGLALLLLHAHLRSAVDEKLVQG